LNYDPASDNSEVNMQRKPEIGDHVEFPGNAAVGACTGRVERIYDTFDPDRPWTDVPFDPAKTSVLIRVDQVPNKWPYDGRDTFAPRVSEIEPVDAGDPAAAARMVS
jgi:hypothetical protein